MKLATLALLAGLATANVGEKRAVASTHCYADNCLRALTGTGSLGGTARPAIAKADCSSYLLAVTTTTVTPTVFTATSVVSTVSTATTTVTTTTSTTTTTELDFTTITRTRTFTSITTTTTTPVFQKRSATPSNAIPTYASACSGSVRYVSACSCFGVLSTITSTHTVTAPASTSTTTSVSTIYITSVIVSTSVTLTTTTTTRTTTATSDVTSTTLTTTIATAPATCTSLFILNSAYFYQIYSGHGYTENPNNPSNDAFSDTNFTFDGSLTACAAAAACGAAVFSSAYIDLSFDLHYRISTAKWECVGYFDELSSASDWNVADPDVGASYGYQL